VKLSYNPNETFEQWCERVRQYELEYARSCIAKGDDINLVLEAMSARIQQKILHPVLLEIKGSVDKKY
jgi:hypothetical protein